MDQNQTVDNQDVNNDLQKAIDNITNTTNTDPVFSDPVAAPSSIPEGDTGELSEPVGPFPEANVATVQEGPEPIAPLEAMNVPEIHNFEQSLPKSETAPESEQTSETEQTTEVETESTSANQNLSTAEVKQAALRDLIPLLDKISMTNSQKFKIYREIFEDLKDYTVLEPAYQVARNIEDETERAEALLYLVEAIDKM